MIVSTDQKAFSVTILVKVGNVRWCRAGNNPVTMTRSSPALVPPVIVDPSGGATLSFHSTGTAVIS